MSKTLDEIMLLCDAYADSMRGVDSDEALDAMDTDRAAVVAALREALTERKSFAEVHPANPNAVCKCEHWQSCADCHPTAHGIKDTTMTTLTKEQILKLAREAGFTLCMPSDKQIIAVFVEFAVLCRADLVAEIGRLIADNERLKKALNI